MYTFIVKNIKGEVLHRSVRTFDEVSSAQIEGSKFLSVSRLMDRKKMSAIGNYVEVAIC